MTSRRFFLRTRDSAATAAAVLLVGTLLQSPSENILAVERALVRVNLAAVWALIRVDNVSQSLKRACTYYIVRQ